MLSDDPAIKDLFPKGRCRVCKDLLASHNPPYKPKNTMDGKKFVHTIAAYCNKHQATCSVENDNGKITLNLPS